MVTTNVGDGFGRAVVAAVRMGAEPDDIATCRKIEDMTATVFQKKVLTHPAAFYDEKRGGRVALKEQGAFEGRRRSGKQSGRLDSAGWCFLADEASAFKGIVPKSLLVMAKCLL